MATFDELDWTRFDVDAIVNGRGVGVIDPGRSGACREWLERRGYSIEPWHFGEGIGPAVIHIGHRLRWEEQFGYPLSADSRNLNAFRDGFQSEEWHSDSFVLEVHQAEEAWREDEHWFLGVLSIAQEHSLCSLALGRRFFVSLVLERASPLIGQTIDLVKIPGVYWRPGPQDKEFMD